MKKATTKNRNLIGAAGTYLVAGELSKIGYIALITTRNTKIFDLVASDRKKAVHLQIKTRRTNGCWRLNEKDEINHNKNLFYVFVDISGKIPKFYIIESKFVAKYIKEHYRIWQTKKRKDGEKHKKTPIRTFPEYSKKILSPKYKNFNIDTCENKWGKLGLRKIYK